MYVLPAKGLKIIDPFLGDELPEEGREVAEHGYWYRQLRDKSVVLGSAPEREVAKPSQESEETEVKATEVAKNNNKKSK
jgi:hypothetical protein